MGEASASNVNVLNDISHMLTNLTDELDAMLQEEKIAGIQKNKKDWIFVYKWGDVRRKKI